MDSAIVRSIHQTGKVAGVRAIAEFVEDDTTRRQLARVGIDYTRGFAIPAADAA